MDHNEKPVWRRRLTRSNWLRVMLETVEPGCQIGMEACAGAHYWARKLQQRGYTVRLIIALLGGVLQQGGPQLFSGFHMAMPVAAVACVLATLAVFIIEPGPRVDFIPRD